MRRRWIWGLLAMLVLLGGCGSSEELNTAAVKIEKYEKQLFETVPVTRMDLVPQFTVELTSENQKIVFYEAPFDGLTVKSVNVARGDMVQKGQVLLSFESKEIDKELEELEKTLAEDMLTLEHMQNLMAISSDEGLKLQYEQFTREVTTRQMRIKELKQQAEDYSLIAERDGMVVNLASDLKGSTVLSTQTLIYMSYGDGIYEGTTSENYDFKVGEIYHAEYGMSGYNIRLLNVEGTDEKKLTFQNELTAAEYCPWATLILTLQGQVASDALVVPEKSVFYVEEQAYVYMLDEEGFRTVRAITCGPSADGLIVVLDGLEEGEQVVKQ